MPNTRRQSGRPPAKRAQVVDHLRCLVVSGALAPGARLPTHKELERRFDAESPTIREAMRRVSAEGFVETRHRLGSFVAPHPPHLSQFAFVFPFAPVRMPSQFFTAVRAEAERWQGAARRVLPFFEVNGQADGPDCARLVELVRDHRLAGLVFAANSFALHHQASPLMTTPDLPRVLMETGPDTGGWPTVYPDLEAFLPLALDHLRARGCRRVAVVCLPARGLTAQVQQATTLAAARGLECRPHWVQAAEPSAGPWLGQLAHLLLQGAPDERPDGLVLADDNLVPALTAGLATTGLRVRAATEPLRRGDLAVVAHTNFPHPTASAVPVTRLGYDIALLVATCMERIAQQRRGEHPRATTLLPPYFAPPPSSVAAWGSGDYRWITGTNELLADGHARRFGASSGLLYVDGTGQDGASGVQTDAE